MFYRNLILNKMNRSSTKGAWFNTHSEQLMKTIELLVAEGTIKWAGCGKGEVRYKLA